MLQGRKDVRKDLTRFSDIHCIRLNPAIEYLMFSQEGKQANFRPDFSTFFFINHFKTKISRSFVKEKKKH